MSSVRNLAPPSMPIPPATYVATYQTLLNTILQQFGARVSTAVNQLLIANTPVSLTYSAVLVPPAATFVIYRVNLTGNVQLNPPQEANDGDTIILWFMAGSAVRTVTLGATIKVPTGITPTTIAAGKKAVYTLRYDAVLNNGQWELAAYQNGY